MENIETKVKAAVQGDKTALEEVVQAIQQMIFNLAVRMLWHPGEAKDATQEVLIRIVTNLSTFQHKSSFKTWVYRIASNTLINYNQKRLRQNLSFTQYADYLNKDLSDSISYTSNKGEQNLLVAEAKIGCSNAMLQCLNKEERLVYIIGEILEMTSMEGAEILDISPTNFRKKLSRIRKKLHTFMNHNCGIINKNNACRCRKKVDSAIKNGFIQPKNLLFVQNIDAKRLVEKIEDIENEVSLFRTNLSMKVDGSLLDNIKQIITATVVKS